MITSKKIVKIGKSSGIILDVPVLKILNAKHGDMVEINVKKIMGENKKWQ